LYFGRKDDREGAKVAKTDAKKTNRPVAPAPPPVLVF
jgi:hypothetical protein